MEDEAAGAPAADMSTMPIVILDIGSGVRLFSLVCL
jgi:hypothetical protein